MSKEFKSKIDVQSESFLKNRAEMLEKIKKMKNLEKRSFNASESKRKKFEDRNQLTPRERLNALIDPDSEFIELYNMAGFLVEDSNPETSIPGASVIGGIGFIKGVEECILLYC